MDAPERLWIHKHYDGDSDGCSTWAWADIKTGGFNTEYIRADLVAEKDKEIATLKAQLKASDMNFTSADKCLWREMQQNKVLKRAVELAQENITGVKVSSAWVQELIAQAEAELAEEADDAK